MYIEYKTYFYSSFMKKWFAFYDCTFPFCKLDIKLLI